MKKSSGKKRLLMVMVIVLGAVFMGLGVYLYSENMVANQWRSYVVATYPKMSDYERVERDGYGLFVYANNRKILFLVEGKITKVDKLFKRITLSAGTSVAVLNYGDIKSVYLMDRNFSPPKPKVISVEELSDLVGVSASFRPASMKGGAGVLTILSN